jgi:hypothetical protein
MTNKDKKPEPLSEVDRNNAIARIRQAHPELAADIERLLLSDDEQQFAKAEELIRDWRNTNGQ